MRISPADLYFVRVVPTQTSGLPVTSQLTHLAGKVRGSSLKCGQWEVTTVVYDSDSISIIN